MKQALIFGPFVGEEIYEACYFAPHAIYKKLENPECDLIVFTRPDRLDLYGTYTDIFVPLTIENDDIKFQKHWGATVYTKQIVGSLIGEVKRKFVTRYNLISHFAPQLYGYKSQLKWQFPRDQMSYNFEPRCSNKRWVDKYYKNSYILCDYENFNIDENIIKIKGVIDKYKSSPNKSNITLLGVIIEVIRKCDFFIGDLNTIYCRLAFLMNKPVISKTELKGDSIHTIKPFRSPVILCDSEEEGVKTYYENYI